jgi:hypothetical protein
MNFRSLNRFKGILEIEKGFKIKSVNMPKVATWPGLLSQAACHGPDQNRSQPIAIVVESTWLPMASRPGSLLGQPMGMALACGEHGAEWAPTLRCAGTPTTWHSRQRLTSGQTSVWSSRVGSSGCAARTGQQCMDHITAIEGGGMERRLTGGGVVFW